MSEIKLPTCLLWQEWHISTREKRNSLHYCFIMSEQSESILALMQPTDTGDDNFSPSSSHPPSTPFLLAVPVDHVQSLRQVPTPQPTPVSRGRTRGPTKEQPRRSSGQRQRGGWGQQPSSSVPSMERLSSVMCPSDSAGWLRTVHHRLISLGLAIAEKTSIEEVHGSSHSASFPGHLKY